MRHLARLAHATRRLAAAAAVLAAPPLAAAPQSPIRFDRLSLEQGLSQATVLCFLQDSRGYVWLGTEDGLNRYDGRGFRVYKPDPADPASLPASFVLAIAEDAAGDLWLATDGGGLALWRRATDRFESQPAAGSGLIRTLAFAPDGDLWIGTRNEGLLRRDGATGTLTPLRHDPVDPGSLTDDRVSVLHFDAAGRLWVGTDGGLDRLDPGASRFAHLRHRPGDPSSLAEDRVRALASDRQGALWVGTFGSGLARLEPSTGRFESFRHDPADPASLAHDQVRAVHEDASGRLWVGTSGGLDLFDRRGGGGFLHYRRDPADLFSLADDHVTVLAEDRGGVLWVGTRLGGAHKWNPLGWQFGHVPARPQDPAGLASGHITSFAEDRGGRLWIGTYGAGLAAMERLSGRTTQLRAEPGRTDRVASDRVMALLLDHQGGLWVGTLDAGLDRYDPSTGAFRHFRHDPQRPDSLPADGVMSLLEDRAGALWVGTFGGGLARLDPGAAGFVRYRPDPRDPASLGGDRVTALAEAPDGRVWVGSDGGGLGLLDPANGRVERHEHRRNDPGSLPSDTIYAVTVDAAGGLWAGTRAGLAHLAAGDTAFETFGSRNGLANETVYSVRPDRRGALWLSTNNGLARFDPGTARFTNFSPSQGLQGSEFNFGASYQSASGELFFGGLAGFNAFFPERLQWNERPPAVVLAAAAKDHEPLPGPVEALDGVELGFGVDVLRLEFAVLDYTAPHRNRLSYRLEGFDEGWVEAPAALPITYTSLDPGHYRLRVRGANADGTWSATERVLEVVVHPAPWQTRWAYLSYSFVLVGGFVGAARLQQRKLAREAEYARRLEDRVQERTRELAERQAELERANRDLARASITDALTGLANRRFLSQYLEKEVVLLHRRYRALDEGTFSRASLDLAFMMIDLDSFKSINDSAGHAAGDEVLRQMKDILLASCRAADLVIRWGGDEFLVVARDLAGENLGALAERIRAHIAGHVFDLGDGSSVRTTCSIGFACYPFHRGRLDALTWEQVVSAADRALYVAKESGRNRWVGLGSNDQTPIEGLFAALRNDLPALVHAGLVEVTSSAEPASLTWGDGPAEREY